MSRADGEVFRCPVCQHVVKYEDPHEDHCPGCARPLSLTRLTLAPGFQAHQCYCCWLKSPTSCDFFLSSTTYEQIASECHWVTFEHEVYTCPSCLRTLEQTREVFRELNPTAVALNIGEKVLLAYGAAVVFSVRAVLRLFFSIL